MLVRFTFENHLSFQAATEISFVATRGKDHLDHLSHVAALGDDVLPVVGLYGANASGKSNALSALLTMAKMLKRAVDVDGALPPLPHAPFRLQDGASSTPTTFDADLVIDKVRYRYGLSYDAERIVGEWLHAWPKGTRQIWFERDITPDRGWYFGPGWRTERQRLADATLPDELFLTKAAHRGHEGAVRVRSEFKRWSGEESTTGILAVFQKSPLFDAGYRDQILTLLRGADLGIVDFRVLNWRQRIIGAASRLFKSAAVKSASEAYDTGGDPSGLELGHAGLDGQVSWLPPEQESAGTLKLLDHLHHVLEALRDGGLLVVDELDLALHPDLTPLLVRLFTDPVSNPKGAQLLFTTHQTALMGHLRRDEVYLAEKDIAGRSTLIPVSDFRTLKREDLERYYRDGRYGGVPRLGALKRAFRRGPTPDAA